MIMKKYFLIGLPDSLLGTFGENFNNYPLVKNMKNPKLFLHGTRDGAIDIKYARQLYGQAADPKDFLWVDGGHVLLGDTERAKGLSGKIRTFLNAYLQR